MPGSLGKPVGREPSPVEVVKPGKLEDEETAEEEADDADDVAAVESVEGVAADAEDFVVFAVSEVADVEGDDEAVDEATGEVLAVESESLGRSCAAASEASRIEIARREREETNPRCRTRMLVAFQEVMIGDVADLFQCKSRLDWFSSLQIVFSAKLGVVGDRMRMNVALRDLNPSAALSVPLVTPCWPRRVTDTRGYVESKHVFMTFSSECSLCP